MHRAFYVEDSHVYPNVTDRIIELMARSKYMGHFVDEQQRPWEGDHKMRFAWKLSTCRQLSSRRHCSHSSHTTPPFLPSSLSSFFLVSLTSLQRSVSWVSSIIWALAAATPPSSQLWTFFYWVLSLAGLDGGEASRWKCFPLFQEMSWQEASRRDSFYSCVSLQQTLKKKKKKETVIHWSEPDMVCKTRSQKVCVCLLLQRSLTSNPSCSSHKH